MKLGHKRVFHFTIPGNCPFLRKVKVKSQAGKEIKGGTEKEGMEEW